MLAAPGPSLMPVAVPGDVIKGAGGGFAEEAVAGDIKAAGADPESPLDESVIGVLDYLSGGRDSAGGYRNPGGDARDALGSKLNAGAMGVGPAAKRTQSLRAAADSDTTAGATYDTNGNLTRIEYDGGACEAWTYDAATGQVASYTDQEGRVTKQRIDPATGRVVAVVRVVGLDDDASAETDDLVTAYAYTDGGDGLPAGLLRSITDPTGSVTRIEYDADADSPDYGRAIALTYAHGTADASTVLFGYDAAGNVDSLTDAVDNATTWTLDAAGRVTSESITINQQTLTRQYVYYENGRLRRYTDRNHRTTEYVYYATGDAAGLVQYERWFAAYANPDTATPVRVIEYGYTYAAGRLIGFTVNDTDVDFVHTYDAAGYLNRVRVLRRRRRGWARAIRALVRRGHNPDTATPVRVIEYGYTYAAGRLIGFTVDDTDVDFVYTYDAAGYLTGTSWDFAGLADPNDVTLAYTYGRDEVTGLPIATVAATVDGTADFSNAYAYDSFGRLTQVTQTSVQGGNAVSYKRIDFSYNAAGQFETIARYADVDFLVASTTYGYDADLGCLVEMIHAVNWPMDTLDYHYNYETDGEITRMSVLEDGGAYTYEYDATGPVDRRRRSHRRRQRRRSSIISTTPTATGRPRPSTARRRRTRRGRTIASKPSTTARR